MPAVLPPTHTETRLALQLVATHVLARARHVTSGRFGLRVTPGGFGTPEFGPDHRRIRVRGDLLVLERAGEDGASTRTTAIGGSTLAALARFADVDLTAPFSVGHDTPGLGDPEAPLAVDPTAATLVGAWFDLGLGVLDGVVARHPDATPTVAQLWPEHFDVGLDLEVGNGGRVNVGASPGDEAHPEPYLYLGPWDPARPGDPAYWNAPFGAVLGYADLLGTPDPLAAGQAFVQRGLDLLAG